MKSITVHVLRTGRQILVSSTELIMQNSHCGEFLKLAIRELAVRQSSLLPVRSDEG